MLVVKLKDKMKEYEVDQHLDNQDDLGLFIDIMDMSESEYICDAIGEVSDSWVSVYTSDILDNAKNLYVHGWHQDALDEGLTDKKQTLEKQLSSAWYKYNTAQLYNNLDAIIYNYALQYMINNDIMMTMEEFEDLEMELEGIDNNNTFDDIIDTINDIKSYRE